MFLHSPHTHKPGAQALSRTAGWEELLFRETSPYLADTPLKLEKNIFHQFSFLHTTSKQCSDLILPWGKTELCMMLSMLTGHLCSLSNLSVEFALSACVHRHRVKMGYEASGKSMHRSTLRSRISSQTIKDNGFFRNIYKLKLLMLK